jgi:hypothetical protein
MRDEWSDSELLAHTKEYLKEENMTRCLLSKSHTNTMHNRTVCYFKTRKKYISKFCTKCATLFDRKSIKQYWSEIRQKFGGRKSGNYIYVSRSKEGRASRDYFTSCLL